MRDASGVVEVDVTTSAHALAGLEAEGAQAARVRLHAARAGHTALACEALARRLPPDWPLEVAGSWATLASIAAVLSRVDRAIVAVPDSDGADALSAAQMDRLEWWLAMGNVRVRLVGPVDRGPAARWRGLYPDRFIDTAAV